MATVRMGSTVRGAMIRVVVEITDLIGVKTI